MAVVLYKALKKGNAMKENIIRISVDIVLLIIFGYAIHVVFQSDSAGMNPVDVSLLIPFKLSLAVIYWILFRKVVMRKAGEVNWNTKLKDLDANALFAMISFLAILLFYKSYS